MRERKGNNEDGPYGSKAAKAVPPMVEMEIAAEEVLNMLVRPAGDKRGKEGAVEEQPGMEQWKFYHSIGNGIQESQMYNDLLMGMTGDIAKAVVLGGPQYVFEMLHNVVCIGAAIGFKAATMPKVPVGSKDELEKLLNLPDDRQQN